MPLIQQAINQPEQFDLVQLIRIVNRRLSKSDQPFDLFIEADPMPNNLAMEVSEFQISESSATISSNVTSLTSGDAVVPIYIYEALLKAFHEEQFALADFLNIFNDRYFKLYARTVEKSHLLLTAEFDHFFQRNSQQQKQQNDLIACLTQLCGLPQSPENKNWLGYGLLLGMPNRSLHNLQQVLADYFSLAVTINSSQVNKHQLSQENWTRLGPKKSPGNKQVCGQNNQLGRGFLLGQHCWLSKQKIIVTISVSDKEQLATLTLDINWYKEMAQMARYYLRDKTEIAIYLEAPDKWFPRTQLSTTKTKTVRLGRGFHLKSSQQDSLAVYLIHLVKD